MATSVTTAAKHNNNNSSHCRLHSTGIHRMCSLKPCGIAFLLFVVAALMLQGVQAFAPPTAGRSFGIGGGATIPHHHGRMRHGCSSMGGGLCQKQQNALRFRPQHRQQQRQSSLQLRDSLQSPPPPADGNDNDEEPFELQAWLQTNLFFGLEPTPEIIAIMTIYFVEGAVGLARLAQTYLLKDQLHLGPAEMSALSGLFVLPWTIKPLYGFLSDGLPLFGYKRKSYLIAAGLLGGVSYGVLGWSSFWDGLDSSTALTGTCAALILSSACVAFSDVVADGIVVTRTRKESAENPALAGSLQSLCWGSSAIGALLSAYFSGSLLEVLSVRGVFGLTAVLPFLVALIALGVDEEPIVQAEDENAIATFVDGVKEQGQTLWGALRQPAIWRPALFLFLWQSTPTSDGAFFYFLTDDLGLGPEFMGRVRLVTAAAGLVGIWLYQQFFRTTRIKDLLFWSTIISFPLGLLPLLLITHTNQALGIPDTALIYGDDVVLAALGTMTFMPTLVLAARLCPPGVEAVLFATLMSSFNAAGTLGTEIGALLTKLLGVTETNFDNLALLTIICNVSSLYPLAFIGWLDEVGDAPSEDEPPSIDSATDDGVIDVPHYGDDVY